MSKSRQNSGALRVNSFISENRRDHARLDRATQMDMCVALRACGLQAVISTARGWIRLIRILMPIYIIVPTSLGAASRQTTQTEVQNAQPKMIPQSTLVISTKRSGISCSPKTLPGRDGTQLAATRTGDMSSVRCAHKNRKRNHGH